jgi:hypothetical protein
MFASPANFANFLPRSLHLPMPYYRCYFLTNAGSIAAAETFECVDDAGAMAQTAALLAERGRFPRAEVWERARLVGTRSQADGEGE